MNPYFFLGLIVICLWAAGLFIGAVKGMSRSFDNTPAIESTNSRETREEFTRRAAEIEERNRRLMDDVKNRMERSHF